MSVVVSVEQAGPCRKQVRIEVPAPAVDAEVARVVAALGRKARIPGFRKGKVPSRVVRLHFGHEIEHEVVERLVPLYWKQAAAEKQIDALQTPEVGEVEFTEGAPLRFTASVETRPEFELRNIQDFNLPELPVEPAEAEIDETLEGLRQQRATWHAAGRPAARGDRVKARIIEFDDDGHEGEAQEAEIEVGGARVWEEVTLALTGLGAGRSTEFERHEEAAGETPARTRRFRIEALEVQEAEVPPLDDELAKSFGKFADLAALRTDVSQGIRAAKAQERRRRREHAVLEQLIERHPFELPQGVVGHEIEHLLRDYAEGLTRRGVDVEHAEIDWSKLGEEVRPQAERRVQSRFLLDKIAEEREITVGEEEFERALATLARAQGRSTVAVRQALDQAGQLGRLRAQMRRDKVLSFLLGETPAPVETAVAATEE